MAGFGVRGIVALRQPFHFQVFSHSKEGIELFLSNIHLAVIHEVQDGDKVGILDALITTDLFEQNFFETRHLSGTRGDARAGSA